MRSAILRIFLSILLPIQSHGAVTLDSNGSWQTGSNVTSVTFSHTVSGEDPLLEVNVDLSSAVSVSCTGVTFDGDAMTAGPSRTSDSTFRIYKFYMEAPEAKTANIVVSFSYIGNMQYRVKAVSWNGVAQSSALLDSDGADGSGFGPFTLTLDTQDGGLLSDLFVAITGSDDITEDGSQTSLGESVNVSFHNSGASYKEAEGTSDSMSWSVSEEFDPNKFVAVSFAPASAPSGPSMYPRRIIGLW